MLTLEDTDEGENHEGLLLSELHTKTPDPSRVSLGKAPSQSFLPTLQAV